MQPKIIEVNGKPGVHSIFLDQVQLTPLGCVMTIERPDGITAVNAQADRIIFDREGSPLGFALELAQEAVNLKPVIQRFSREAHEHPERDALKSFTCEMEVGEFGYRLRWDTTGEFHPLQAIHIEGTFSFSQSEMPFTATELGDRRFGAGQGLIFGWPGVWVSTTDQNKDITTVSCRMLDDKPLFGSVATAPHKFPELAEVVPPPGWVEAETPSDI